MMKVVQKFNQIYFHARLIVKLGNQEKKTRIILSQLYYIKIIYYISIVLVTYCVFQYHTIEQQQAKR